MKRFITVLIGLSLLFSFVGCTHQTNEVDMSKVNDVAGLSNSMIAVQSGTLHQEIIDKYQTIKTTSYPEFSDMVTAVLSGAVNGAFMDEPVAIKYCIANNQLDYVKLINNENGFACEPAYYQQAVGIKKNSPLKDQINAILATIDVDTRNALMEQMIKISTGEKVETLALTSELVESDKVLKVGMECASDPFNWTDPNGTSLQCVPIANEGFEGLYANGYDVQVAKYICNKLGYKLEVYALEWDSLIPAVESGVIDCIIGNMSPTPVRWEKIDFTDSYYDVNYVVLYKK